MKKQVYLWVLATLLVVACTNEDSEIRPIRHGQSFRIGVEQYDDLLYTDLTRTAETVISQLKVAIYDNTGQLVINQNSEQSADFKSFIVEGLPDGDYTAVFMGVGEVRTEVVPTITIPDMLEGEWIPKMADGEPVLNEYLYTQCPFSIHNGVGATNAVELSRIVGRIEIEPIYGDKQWAEGSLTSISVSLDGGTIYTSHLNNGTYSGEGYIANFEAIQFSNFYTLPTIEGKIPSGYVILKGTLSDGSPSEVRYEFELKIEPNKRAVLHPRYAPDGDQFGTFRLYDRDRNVSNSHLFFQDGDSYKSVASRSFRPIQPLVASFKNGKMTTSFYAILPVRDVTLLARRPTDNEYFELAWFESILAFEDRTVDLPTASKDKLYRTESGKTVAIDKLTNDMVFKYRSSDPLIKKLATITWPAEIRLTQPGNDTLYNKQDDLALRAVHAREAVAMFTNMAFVFSHPDWKREMLASEVNKPFTDNNRTVSCEGELFPKIWNVDYKGRNYIKIYVMSPKTDQSKYGVAYVGSGDYLTMQQHVYAKHYPNIANSTGIVTSYHEYSHTLGYGHSGNLTYNEYSTVTEKVCRSLYAQQATPYLLPSVLNSLNNNTLYKKAADGSIW